MADQVVAITQRVDVVSPTGERRDTLDQRWAPFLELLGYTIAPVPNCLEHPAVWFQAQKCTGLIISGGNDLSHLIGSNQAVLERDQTEIALFMECQRRKLPVIGVCRGMQMINHIFGGTQRRCENHAGTRHALHFADGIDKVWKRQSVNSYHDWGIPAEGLAGDLTPLCYSEDGLVEAFVASDMLVSAIMWHPERESSFNELDIQLFRMVLGSSD